MSRQGSAILPVLVVLAVVSYMAVRAMQIVAPLLEIRRQDSLRSAREGISTSYKMMYRLRGTCMRNLIKQDSFGLTLTDLASRSAAGNLRVPYASADGNSAAKYLAVNSETNGMRVEKVTLSEPTLLATKNVKSGVGLPSSGVPPTGMMIRSYILDLTMSMRPLAQGIPLKVVIPFYVFTDTSGTITDCYASSYNKSGVTSEDQLCAMQNGSAQYYFSPVEHTCNRRGAAGT